MATLKQCFTIPQIVQPNESAEVESVARIANAGSPRRKALTENQKQTILYGRYTPPLKNAKNCNS